MSRSDKRKKETGALQRAGQHTPAPVVQTPQGPAVIQVIDIPSQPGGSGGPGPASPSGGLNILRAIMRRWWLVLLVTVLVGGSGVILASRLIKPNWEADAYVLYQPLVPARANLSTVATDPGDIVKTQIELLTRPEIALLAARSPELQQALPWLKGLDLENPAVQRDVTRRLKGMCEATQVKTADLIQIHSSQSDGHTAAAIANAFADAFVQHCSNRVLGRDAVRRQKLQEQIDQQDALLKELNKAKIDLTIANDLEFRNQQKASMVNEVGQYQKLKTEADIRRIAAQAELNRYLQNQGGDVGLSSAMQLARKLRIEEEKLKDPLLQAALAEQNTAHAEYKRQIGLGKGPEHRDVIFAKRRFENAQAAVSEQSRSIEQAIDARIRDQQRLLISATMEEAAARLREAEAAVAAYETRLAQMDQQATRLAVERQKVEQLDDAINRVRRRYDDLYTQMQALNLEQQSVPDAIITVAERADTPLKPTDDKRVKIQAASVVGGLLLGIMMALLVDRFDRRLRDPRDIEQLMDAPMLGMIPKVQELNHARGEQARNVVAEEFRIIRTQLLFGQPDGSFKTLCITSPTPGDGKTSLAVNLAISFAKAGRRVLLIDADLQKPDIHRIFNMPESPGFCELIQGTADSSSAVRHSDVGMLDVLPAGVSVSRPCELLSRPEVPSLLAALGEMYDHIFLDTSPLLPVCDTHVLVSRTDGVICTFNAQADTDTIHMTGQILRRSRAHLIGSVVNQVRYRQSTSYYRGRLAYSSYYSYSNSSGRSLGHAEPPAENSAGPGNG